MSTDSFFQSKRPLWRLFTVVTVFVIVIPATLWGIVQLYEILCAWGGGCEGMTRPRGQSDIKNPGTLKPYGYHPYL